MSITTLASLPAIPSELKSITPYLQRAKEVEKVDRVITYWCCFHAAQTCMSIRPTEKESRTFLIKLLDYLEQTKASLSDHDAITNNLAAAAYVENFALKIFNSADQEELRGNPNKSTAGHFLVSACFLEVLQSLTNQPEPDILEKIKYAKWKASSIVKTLRDGPSTSQHSDPETNQSVDRSSTQPDPSSSSSVNSPTPQSLDTWPTNELAPNSVSQLPSPPDPNLTLKSNNLNGFASTVFPPPIYDSSHHLLPSVPAAEQSIPSVPDLDPSRMAIEPVIGIAPRHFPSRPPPPPPHPASGPPPTFSQGVIPPVGLPPTDFQHPASSIQTTKIMDPALIEQIQKHAKWAISALNYEDVPTARKELLKALEQLSLLE